MSGLADFDLDRSTAQAWRSFQARLADHLAEMGADDRLVLAAGWVQDDAPGSPPCVRFTGSDGCDGVADTTLADDPDGDSKAEVDEAGRVAMLRGEVSGNAHLAQQFELDDLLGLGWPAPSDSYPDAGDGSGNFSTEVPRAEADRLAVMAVRALREVFAVPHPAFLDIEGMEPEEVPPTVPAPPVADPVADEAGWPEDVERAVMPESPDHLRKLVDEALTPLFGEAPQHDEDGDIPVPWGSSLVFVHVNEEAPVVELASTVVSGVAHRDRAAFEVGVLNRDQRYLTFVLLGDRVDARLNLPACPFVPEHLRFMLTGMSFRLDEIGEDLVARVGGRLALAPDGAEVTMPEPGSTLRQDHGEPDETALLTMLQLDADGTGSVDTELAAGVCGFDQGRIVRLLGRTDEQESAWRRSRDEALRSGDRAEARSCQHELEAWQRTTRVLRRALRLVVERSLGREGIATAGYPTSKEGRRTQPPRPTRRRPDGEGV